MASFASSVAAKRVVRTPVVPARKQAAAQKTKPVAAAKTPVTTASAAARPAAAPAAAATPAPAAAATQESPAGRGPSPFTTVPGQLVNSGISGLVDLGNKFSDNATIGGLVAGKIGDVYGTQANTGLALAYNDAFLGSLGSYQQALENTKKGNAMELMSAEGRIAKDLQADKLATDRYGFDQQLAGTKYQSDSEERQIGLKGSEDRRTLITQTDQQLALRRDARGAIASAGRRFYG